MPWSRGNSQPDLTLWDEEYGISRMLTTLAASVVAPGALIVGVEVRTVFDEINGQRCSYDINNRQQTAGDQMASEVEGIVVHRVDGEEALG